MIPTLRERATDKRGIVHEVAAYGWSLLTTRCLIQGQWADRDFATNAEVMTWDGFDPTPEITCMACLVRKGRM